MFELHPAGSFSSSIDFPHGAANGQAVGGVADGTSSEAYLFTATKPAGVSLQTTGYTASTVLATDGARQGGYATTDFHTHAMLWSGSASSAIDLHPAGTFFSALADVSASQQVGYGRRAFSDPTHAYVWTGSATSVVDLHPGAAYANSSALGTDGARQVGVAVNSAGAHAFVWSGTADSGRDIHPAGYTRSTAEDVAGTQVVGWVVTTAGATHAGLWNDSAASFVDLHPAGFEQSRAFSTDGTLQVGYARSGLDDHAMLWSGSAASALDLGALLGPTFAQSVAQSVAGNLVYGTAVDTSNRRYAIVWTVPEPTSALALLGIVGLRRRRSR